MPIVGIRVNREVGFEPASFFVVATPIVKVVESWYNTNGVGLVNGVC
jgi:hypothetical protein